MSLEKWLQLIPTVRLLNSDTGSCLQQAKNVQKEPLVVTGVFNIVVNDFERNLLVANGCSL